MPQKSSLKKFKTENKKEKVRWKVENDIIDDYDIFGEKNQKSDLLTELNNAE